MKIGHWGKANGNKAFKLSKLELNVLPVFGVVRFPRGNLPFWNWPFQWMHFLGSENFLKSFRSPPFLRLRSPSPYPTWIIGTSQFNPQPIPRKGTMAARCRS
jgi:hypothetical protein